MRPEHRFSGTLEQWDRAVFENAAYFTVVEFLRGTRPTVVQQHTTFADAVKAATPMPRVLIYAVTASERWALVPRDQWAALQGNTTARTDSRVRVCKGCGKGKGLATFNGEHWHPSCWRIARMK